MAKLRRILTTVRCERTKNINEIMTTDCVIYWLHYRLHLVRNSQFWRWVQHQHVNKMNRSFKTELASVKLNFSGASFPSHPSHYSCAVFIWAPWPRLWWLGLQFEGEVDIV
jgi:hypothetical protein